MNELSVLQLAIIGFLASALIQAIKLISAKFNFVLSKEWIAVVAFVVSVILAIIWMTPQVILTGDPATVVVSVIKVAGEVVGFATVIYLVLLKRIIDGMGLNVKNVKPL